MNNHYDAIIIGAGVIGSAIGFELAKKGWRVLNIDKNPASGYGSTAASCAIIRVHYSTFDGCALAYEGYHYWKNWSSYLGLGEDVTLSKFIQCGCMIYRTESNNYLKTIIARADELSIPYEIWSPEKIKHKLPISDLNMYAPVKRLEDPHFGLCNNKTICGALFFPTAGFVNDPKLSAYNLQLAGENRGSKFWFNKTVSKILKFNGRVSGVALSDGTEISSGIVVNAGGPHSAKINALAGLKKSNNIKTKALKVEVSHVSSPKGFNYERSAFVVSDSDIGCYSRPETGNNILIGSEDPECDQRIFVDPDNWDENFTEQLSIQVLRQSQRYPGISMSSQTKGIVSLYDVSDDWIPIYDKSDLPGFYMAIGTSGNQYKNAPVAGVMMSNLIESVEDGLDHDYQPLQLNLRYINRKINMGFYSRNRKVNQESSMSVLG